MYLKIGILTLLLNVAMPLHAAVNDIFPGDYFPTRPGQSTLAVYAFDRTQTGPYSSRKKLLDGKITSQTMALRLTHGFSLGDKVSAAVLVLPAIKADISPLPLATALGTQISGLADLRLGITSWLINDRTQANYLGLSAMLILPTGDYRNSQIINPGENRWKFILGGGWQKDITPKFLFELAPEIALYGNNNDYAGGRRMEQRPSYALTGYLRYRMSSALHWHVGGQMNAGGETRINNVDQNNQAKNNRVMAGVTLFLPEGQQLILRAARDTTIASGFKTDREVALRYLKLF